MSVYPDASGSPSTRPTGKELRIEMKGQLQAVRQKATSGNTAHWCPEDRGNPTVVIVVLLRHNISSTQCLSRSYALLYMLHRRVMQFSLPHFHRIQTRRWNSQITNLVAKFRNLFGKALNKLANCSRLTQKSTWLVY